MTKWLTQYLANLNGESTEAKALQGSLQTIGSGGSKYIAWADMECKLLQQDPAMEFKFERNDDGGHVFTDTVELLEHQKSDDRETTTNAKAFSHVVRVSCTFLDKTMVEVYPIQRVIKGKGYTPVKAYDQNDVNKSLKRAMAKVGSRVSGLGLNLYIGKDLQFEDDDTKPTTPTTTTEPIKETITEVVVPKTIEQEIVSEVVDDLMVTMAKELKENASYSKGLAQINQSIHAKLGFMLSQDDTIEELAKKLAQTSNPSKVLESIKKLSQ